MNFYTRVRSIVILLCTYIIVLYKNTKISYNFILYCVKELMKIKEL